MASSASASCGSVSVNVGEPDEGTFRVEAFRSPSGAMVCEFRWESNDGESCYVGLVDGIGVVELTQFLVESMRKVVGTRAG